MEQFASLGRQLLSFQDARYAEHTMPPGFDLPESLDVSLAVPASMMDSVMELFERLGCLVLRGGNCCKLYSRTAVQVVIEIVTADGTMASGIRAVSTFLPAPVERKEKRWRWRRHCKAAGLGVAILVTQSDPGLLATLNRSSSCACSARSEPALPPVCVSLRIAAPT